MSDIYKLCYKGNAIIVDRLPLSNWTIVDTGQLSVNGNTITQNGIGGWCESMYISFTVPETGSYEISYDYDITAAVVGSHGTYGFGLWLTTNNPNVTGNAQYDFYANSDNRNGPNIGNTNQDISGMKGHISYKTTLNAGTTYYLWYPGAALNDGTTFTLSFSNINVFNDPIQYDYVNLNTLTFPSWNGHLTYEEIERIFHVIVNQTTGGTIAASPIEGTNGTIVTLSNTPSTDYEFVNYSVTGATLNNNQFTINGSDVTATGLFRTTKEVWVNLGSTEYSQTSKGTKTVTLTGMPSSSHLNYFTLVLDAHIFTRTSSTAGLFYLLDSSSNGIWVARTHRSLNNYFGFVGIANKVTAWSTQSGVTVTSDTQDGTSYRCSSLWSDAYKRIKFVFDRSAKRCYFYMSGTLLGYATLSVDAIILNKLSLTLEQANTNCSLQLKNIRVAGFSTLDAAKNYNG